MAMKYIALARKLQSACNKQFGTRLLLNSRQWYSEDQHRAVTVYSIHQSVRKEGSEKDISVELFKTYSQVRLVLFLRDYWYKLNGWEVPKDNKMWEEVKDQNVENGTENTETE